MASVSETRLAAIYRASPEVRVTADKLHVSLPYGCFVSATLEGTGANKHSYIENFDVPDDLQSHGIGTRLLKALFRYCSVIEVKRVDTDILSPAAMRVMGRVFGEAALHFIERGETETEVPLTVEQANLSIARTENAWEAATEAERDTLDAAIFTRVHLDEVDTSTWEMPVLRS